MNDDPNIYHDNDHDDDDDDYNESRFECNAHDYASDHEDGNDKKIGTGSTASGKNDIPLIQP